MQFKIKTLLLVMLMAFTVPRAVDAQKTSLTGGLFVTSDVAVENLEIGQTFGKNTLSAVGQSYQITPTSTRNWSGGVKYYRTVYSQDKVSLQGNTLAQLNFTGSNQSLTVEPGLNINYSLNKSLSLSVGISTPIYENTVLFKPISLEGGIQLVLNL